MVFTEFGGDEQKSGKKCMDNKTMFSITSIHHREIMALSYHLLNIANGVVARLIMEAAEKTLDHFGLEHDELLVTIVYTAMVAGVSFAIGYVAKWLILRIANILAARWNSDAYKALREAGFLHKACRMIPALTFLVLIKFTLTEHTPLSDVLSKLTLIYVVYVTAVAATALIVAVWQHVNRHENKRRLPLNGLAQLARGIVWIVGAVIVAGIVADKSPASLLAGLGAFAAVLMLIFKDSILGLVAGVQLSENDSLHVGDWIKVEGSNANGTVEEVSLTAVKILNWDKTTTTLPPYSLISGGFTNYRSMQQSGTRRICRSYMIDADSILPATAAMLDELRGLPFMDTYITKKLEQRQAGHEADADNPAGLADGTIDTNLGLFRAYMKMWLDAKPEIDHGSDCFVSTLEQTSGGIPFQIYCFSATSQWFPYEAIQSAIFEHIAAMLPAFKLYTFENASGRDTIADGYLSAGGDITDILGVPDAFLRTSDKRKVNKT